MRLWVFTGEYEPYIIGGLGIVASNIAPLLAERGCELTVLSATGGNNVETEQKKNVRIIRFPRKPPYFSHPLQKFYYRPIRRWLSEQGIKSPDLIHIHSVEYTETALYYKRNDSIPIAYTCHSLVIREPKSPLRKLVSDRQEKLLSNADHIIVPSDWEQDQLAKIYPFCSHKTSVIHNGVTMNSRKRPLRRIYSPRYRLLFVGRLVRTKGIEELLRAIAILAKRQHRVRLDVVGVGAVGYTTYLKYIVKKLGIAKKVRWLGYRNSGEVQEMYSSYGAVIVPSREESFGLVALEALASSVPLISTRSGGLANFVNNNVAEVINRVNKYDIALAVRKMWQEKKLTVKRVNEGFKTALMYEWDSSAALYGELFVNMVTTEGDKGE